MQNIRLINFPVKQVNWQKNCGNPKLFVVVLKSTKLNFKVSAKRRDKISF